MSTLILRLNSIKNLVCVSRSPTYTLMYSNKGPHYIRFLKNYVRLEIKEASPLNMKVK